MPPPTTRTSKVRSVRESMSRVIVLTRAIEARGDSGDSIVLPVATIDEVRSYWNQHIHDLEITRHPVGSRGFFDDLDQYHFEKLHHLPRLVSFDGYRGRRVLAVGCGAGVDLARFAKGGADVTGVDLAMSAIDLARTNFDQQGLRGTFNVLPRPIVRRFGWHLLAFCRK